MKTILTVLWLLTISVIGYAQGSPPIVFDENDFVWDFPQGDIYCNDLVPTGTIEVDWVNTCEGTLTIDFSNFDIGFANGSGDFFGTVFVDLKDANDNSLFPDPIPLDALFIITLDVPNEVLDLHLEFSPIGFQQTGGVNSVCYEAELHLPTIDFTCPCDSYTDVVLVTELVDCSYDQCTGARQCEYILSTEFYKDGVLVDPPVDAHHSWRVDGVEIGEGSPFNYLLVPPISGGSCTDIELVLTVGNAGAGAFCVESLNECLFCIDENILECSGVSGERVDVTSTLLSCEEVGENLVCTYSVEVIPITAYGFDIQINDVVWDIPGQPSVSGNPITVTISENDSPVTVFGDATGTVDEESCSWNVREKLFCDNESCGIPPGPCEDLGALSMNVKVHSCGTDFCSGCRFRFATVGNIPVGATIEWFDNSFGLNLSIGTGSIIEYCIPEQFESAPIYYIVSYGDNCIASSPQRTVSCEPLACDECDIQTSVEFIFCNYDSDLNPTGCLYNISLDICDEYNIQSTSFYQYNLSVCDADQNCIIDFVNAPISGDFVLPVQIPFEPHQVTFEIIDQNINPGEVVHSLQQVISCDPLDCPVLPINAPTDVPDQSNRENKYEENRLTIDLFPNPAADITTIQFSQPLSSAVFVQLFDQAGKAVKSIKVPADRLLQKIDLNDLPAGIYFLQVSGKEQVMYRGKVLVLE